MKLEAGKDAGISKLKQRNQRAAKVIEEAKDELVKVREKQSNVRELIEGLETKNVFLKERAQSFGDAINEGERRSDEEARSLGPESPGVAE